MSNYVPIVDLPYVSINDIKTINETLSSNTKVNTDGVYAVTDAEITAVLDSLGWGLIPEESERFVFPL